MIKNAENGHFLQAVKSHYFGNFYSKLCCSNRNQVNDMKPKPHKTYFPKFSENINGLFVTPVVIEIFQFESRTSVVVNFCRSEGDYSPVSLRLRRTTLHSAYARSTRSLCCLPSNRWVEEYIFEAGVWESSSPSVLESFPILSSCTASN